MRVHLLPRGIIDLGTRLRLRGAGAFDFRRGVEGCSQRQEARGLGARIRGDREEIVQVLQNLVHNAIKYGREGGHVEVAGSCECLHLCLTAVAARAGHDVIRR